jgi:hypothetical protein
MSRFLRILSVALLWAWSDSRASGENEPDGVHIARLVEQLASAKFKERQDAAKTLEVIGLPALDALRQAAKRRDAEVAQRAARLVATIENGMDQLLVDYRTYGLPLPPAHAKLVRFQWPKGKQRPPTYCVGFLLRVTGDEPATMLVGVHVVSRDFGPISGPPDTIEVLEPKPELAKTIEFNSTFGLVFCLQCKARGWDALAQELWARLKQDSGHPFWKLPSRGALAYTAWALSMEELVRPDTDRIKIAKRMKTILAVEPQLNNQENQALINSLEAALVPSTAEHGTIERMVDDLTEICNRSDPRYLGLGRMGFACVPALIEHLNDDRLTRSFTEAFNNSPRSYLRVKHVVSDLLRGLAGEQIVKSWRQQDGALKRSDAQSWWGNACKVGEEEYFLQHVLPEGDKEAWPNSLMLSIITERYPKHIPKLYLKALDGRPNLQTWPLADALVSSSLATETKLKVIRYAAENKNLRHRRVGLLHLQKLDSVRFMTVLVETLEALPTTPSEPYSKCSEGEYAKLVMATGEAKAWETLEKVAKRSDVGLRMQFIYQVGTGGDRQRQRQCMAFLAAFLDDAEVRNAKANPTMFEGAYAGHMFDRLEVRDLAAMEVASLLHMQEEPNQAWTPDQFEKLRKKVKEALARLPRAP